MHLIAPLASGIVGAGNGTAELYARATGTRANWYTTFEGGTVNSSGNDILLDGNGGAEVYVGQVVDVVVRDSTGTAVREFTAGSAVGSIEVISPSFTGADYVTAAAGTNKPTTAQAVLDGWLTSAGAPDFKVLFGGVATLLQNAIAGPQFYNVRDAKYGATADGTTDDTAAIQAAMDACRDAGGGWVFFPGSDNVYRITAPLTWDGKVNLIGSGPSRSIIGMDHATARVFVGSGTTGAGSPTFMLGLKVSHSQANTGTVIDLTIDAREHVLIGCVFGSNSNSRGIVIDDTASAAIITAYGCRFHARAALILVDTLRATDCRFDTQTWASGTANLIEIQASGELKLSGCEFTPTAFTASTVKCILMGANARANVTGCTFAVFGNTTTGTCFEQGAAGEACVTGCSFGLLSGATAATAFVLAANTAFSESGNSWEAGTVMSPSMTPYSYTPSVTVNQHLGSRSQWQLGATQTGGGTKTLSTELYESYNLVVTDNTAFALALNKAPVGAMAYVVIYSSGGAGTGAITWGANIYGAPVGGFTIATTKARLYTFKSAIVSSTHGWVMVGNVNYGGDL